MSLQDPHLHIEFFSQPERDPKASREEGRPIFRERELVRIKFVGDRKRELVAPAHEPFQMEQQSGMHMTYAERFPEHYAAFKATAASLDFGTPLAMLTSLTSSRIAELQVSAVTTVESLAAVSDSHLAKLGPTTRREREQAQDWLSRVREGAAVNRAAEENASLKERLAALEAKLAALPSQDSTEMSDDQMRAYLAERGVPVRANASREKMREAIAELNG